MPHNLGWYISLLGGTTVFIWVMLIIFAPSALAIVAPIVTALMKGLTSLGSYLWVGFLYISKSVPAALLVLFLLLGVHFYDKSVVKYHNYTQHKHAHWSLKKLLPKQGKDQNSDNHNFDIFTHPL